MDPKTFFITLALVLGLVAIGVSSTASLTAPAPTHKDLGMISTDNALKLLRDCKVRDMWANGAYSIHDKYVHINLKDGSTAITDASLYGSNVSAATGTICADIPGVTLVGIP